ncbi:MAG TPA: glycosyltransferase [Bryobacteraceae bacterium]|nr:glycosyltransferase [Bryobacteraceae bacterium]
MKILIISHAFPPFNSMGAVRIGKTAKYLHRAGHDVRVLTAKDQALDPSLPVEIPSDNVISTQWIAVNRIAEPMVGGRSAAATRGYRPAADWADSLMRRGKSMLHIPDGEIGWLPFAVREGRRIVKDWNPDVILASARPFTSLLAARLVARQQQTPWVAEFRDLWVDSHLYEFGRLRHFIDSRLERWAMETASAIVSVTDGFCSSLAEKYGKRTVRVMNGFDDEDVVPGEPEVGGPLRLVYTGLIIEGKRDPSPLLQAIRDAQLTGDDLQVSFYGRYMEPVRRLAEKYDVKGIVSIHDQVPYRESLRLQRTADALLLINWNHPGENSVQTGKVFEYIRSGRPILAIGSSTSAAATLVSERQAGAVATTPNEIALQLKSWVNEKRLTGSIPAIGARASVGLTRREQTQILETVLESVAAGHAADRCLKFPTPAVSVER